MQITSYTNNHLTDVINKSQLSPTAKSTSENTVSELSIAKSFDTFQYSNSITAVANTYSSATLNVKTAEVANTQTTSTDNDTVIYYDVVMNNAVQKAKISYRADGLPSINSAADYKSYQTALNEIKKTFWCQTGGWENLADNGSAECARTASATMASINSGSVVTPNDTGAQMMSVTVDGIKYNRQGNFNYNYDISKGAVDGYYAYGFATDSDLLEAINTELSYNRSVTVKVETKTGSEHWVTVTGTVDGKKADSFSDLMGVDPWYNGNNTAHGGSVGTGTGACNSSKSGIIQLNTTCKGFLKSAADKANERPAGYRMVTFKFD